MGHAYFDASDPIVELCVASQRFRMALACAYMTYHRLTVKLTVTSARVAPLIKWSSNRKREENLMDLKAMQNERQKTNFFDILSFLMVKKIQKISKLPFYIWCRGRNNRSRRGQRTLEGKAAARVRDLS